MGTKFNLFKIKKYGFFARRAVKARQKKYKEPDATTVEGEYLRTAKELIVDKDSILTFVRDNSRIIIYKAREEGDIYIKLTPRTGVLRVINGIHQCSEVITLEQENYLIKFFHRVNERRVNQMEKRMESKIIESLGGVIDEIRENKQETADEVKTP